MSYVCEIVGILLLFEFLSEIFCIYDILTAMFILLWRLLRIFTFYLVIYAFYIHLLAELAFSYSSRRSCIVLLDLSRCYFSVNSENNSQLASFITGSIFCLSSILSTSILLLSCKSYQKMSFQFYFTFLSIMLLFLIFRYYKFLNLILTFFSACSYSNLKIAS